MFQRKLRALNYCLADDFNYTDESHFRSFILWLEDQKIRLYKIEDRKPLREIDSEKWNNAFCKYLADLKCPYAPDTQRPELIDWLLGAAVRYEYLDHAVEYGKVQPTMPASKSASKTSSNPLDKLDFNDPEFVKGVNTLAALIGINCHSDHLVTLQADNVNLDDFELGLDTGDKVLNQACRVLRLLHVSEVRHLQTKINEAIVAAQEITADPKTDERLGKVGF
ncbi:unnamed protein product [Soboliphyme baturini]|uniref:RNA transcription, translation and transport factor protein n=1 Tax=Soboliphyme baturini TaxID=241478 RepID=A0A183IPE3_9BILA|nr:unnamed protein product [Soboliphyme baturini]